MFNGFPSRSSDVAFRVIDGEAILVYSGNSKIYTLNQVGTAIWELADGTRRLSDIVDVVCNRFDAERDQVSKDCLEFLQDLNSRGILILNEKEAIRQ